VRHNEGLRAFAFGLAVALGDGAGPCSGSSPPADEAEFHFYVLGPECQWPRLLGYTAEEFWPRIVKCPLDQARVVLDTGDIESYDWQAHELLLTPDGSRRFLAMGLSLEADFLAELESTGTAFVVSVGRDFQYAGVFYVPEGAAAIRFPVCHLESRGQQVLFRLHNCQGTEYGVICTDDHIGTPPIKQALAATGKLRAER